MGHLWRCHGDSTNDPVPSEPRILARVGTSSPISGVPGLPATAPKSVSTLAKGARSSASQSRSTRQADVVDKDGLSVVPALPDLDGQFGGPKRRLPGVTWFWSEAVKYVGLERV